MAPESVALFALLVGVILGILIKSPKSVALFAFLVGVILGILIDK